MTYFHFAIFKVEFNFLLQHLIKGVVSLFVNKLFRGKIDKVIFYGKRFF